MNVQTAIEKRRSIRKYQQKPVPESTLLRLVELARLHASGGNAQPIRYAIISQKPLTTQIFPLLKWAMYLPEYDNRDNQQPVAYLLLLTEERTRSAHQFDVGAAATTIMLAAVEEGLATCCLGAIDRPALKTLLGLSEELYPELVISIGYADETSSVVPYKDSLRYYQDDAGNVYVPKRSLEEVLVYSDVKQS